jgi:hypothetical protein
MITMLKNKYVIIAIVAVVLLVAVYFYGRKSYKDKLAGAITKLPGQTNWGGGLSHAESKEVREITLALHADIDKWDLWSTRDVDIYERFASLNDEMFVAVSNDYNTLYPDEGGLRSRINDQWSFGIVRFNQLRDVINRRFDKNNISA